MATLMRYTFMYICGYLYLEASRLFLHTEKQLEVLRPKYVPTSCTDYYSPIVMSCTPLLRTSVRQCRLADALDMRKAEQLSRMKRDKK